MSCRPSNPILIDRDNTMLAGHGRAAAAELIGLAEVQLRDPHRRVARSQSKLLAQTFYQQEHFSTTLLQAVDFEDGEEPDALSSLLAAMIHGFAE